MRGCCARTLCKDSVQGRTCRRGPFQTKARRRLAMGVGPVGPKKQKQGNGAQFLAPLVVVSLRLACTTRAYTPTHTHTDAFPAPTRIPRHHAFRYAAGVAGDKHLPRDNNNDHYQHTCETFQRISSLVMRSVPAGTAPTAYAIHPCAGSCTHHHHISKKKEKNIAHVLVLSVFRLARVVLRRMTAAQGEVCEGVQGCARVCVQPSRKTPCGVLTTCGTWLSQTRRRSCSPSARYSISPQLMRVHLRLLIAGGSRTIPGRSCPRAQQPEWRPTSKKAW